MRKAIFTARKRRPGCSGLARALMVQDGSELRRWDSLFLVPLNQHARGLADLMGQCCWKERATQISFQRPGDTLVIDNWRVLHGRSPVTPGNESRQIERV